MKHTIFIAVLPILSFSLASCSRPVVVRDVRAMVTLSEGWNGGNDVYVEEADLTNGYIRFRWDDKTYISHGSFTLRIMNK